MPGGPYPDPLPAGHPLWKFPNVVITPHVAGNSPGSYARRVTVFKENISHFVRNETIGTWWTSKRDTRILDSLSSRIHVGQVPDPPDPIQPVQLAGRPTSGQASQIV